MIQQDFDRIEYPGRCAAAFFAAALFLIVTTPTGTPAAALHLFTSVAALIGAVAFTALYFERQEY
jgi:hypothetical protein